jgi:hypothetical protein
MPMMPNWVVVPQRTQRKSIAGSLAGAQSRYGRAPFADSPPVRSIVWQSRAKRDFERTMKLQQVEVIPP